MKNKTLKAFAATVALWLMFTVNATAQSFDNIAAAIRTGNAAALAQSFQSNVEITIKDAESSYSKAQAEMVLKNFFASHQPKSFTVVHQGTSPEGSKYFVGNLTTSSGSYRTYVYAKANGNALAILEIRFEEQ